MRAKVFLINDNETTGLGKRAIVFDFAYVIATRKKTLVERSFLVEEIITSPRHMLGAIDNPDWRQTFGGKIFRHYLPELDHSKITIKPWREILAIMRDDILTYDVSVFSAYNLNFDLGALNRTHNVIAEKSLNFSRLDLLCLWNFACVTVCDLPFYHRVAKQQNDGDDWISLAGNVRTNAEKVYAYLTGNFDFIESHTALHDAQIETEIMQRLLAKKKRIPYNEVDHMPWRKAQRIRGTLLDNL